MDVSAKHFSWCSPSFTNGSPMGATVTVTVVRRRGADRFEAGAFKIDTGCLGVRDAVLLDMDAKELAEYKARLEKIEPVVEKPAAWGRKFVEEAVAYARRWGFAPARDFKKAARVFGGSKASDCTDTFTFGYEGKPLYTRGPNDSNEEATRILRVLSLRCGRDGYQYVLPVPEDQSSGDEYAGHVDEIWLVDEVDVIIKKADAGGEDVKAAARSRLRKLQERYPESPAISYSIGLLDVVEGRPSDGRLRFRESVEGAPGLYLAWYNLGQACFTVNRLVEAARVTKRAIETAPEGHEVRLKGQKFLEKLERFQKRSELSHKTFWETLQLLEDGMDAFEAKQYPEALRTFERVRQNFPAMASVWVILGVCHMRMGNWSEAKRHLDEALALDPQNKAAQDNLNEVKAFDALERLQNMTPEEFKVMMERVNEEATTLDERDGRAGQ